MSTTGITNNVIVPLPKLASLSDSTRQRLVSVMHEAIANTDSLRDAFDFRHGCLALNIDTARGESEYFADMYLIQALGDLGYTRVQGVEFDYDVACIEEVYSRKSRSAYIRGDTLVLIHTETDSKLRHRYHDIRFCLLDGFE